MGLITDTANAVYADGPVSDPTEPQKSDIRNLFSTVDGQVEGAAAGLVRAGSLASLNTVTGTRSLQPGEVTNDGANTGAYTWNGSAWIRVGDLIDPVTLQDNIDTADGWRIFFNSVPLLLDACGVVDGTARVYIPQRKFFANADKSIDTSTGTAVGVAFPGYEAVTITRFREGEGGNPVFIWYDLDDPSNPIKQATYNSFPPLDRPDRIVTLLTIAPNGFYSSPVRVVEISGLDGGALYPLGAIVHEGGSILIPSFYQYHWAANAGVVAPATGRFFEFTAPLSSTYAYYYDNMSHAAGGSPIKEVVGAGGYPRREGYRMYEIAKKATTLVPAQGNVVGCGPFRVAETVRNQWPEGKFPDSAARLYSPAFAADSPTELATAGFARCIKSTNTDLYYGGDLGVTSADGNGLRGFGRFYIHSTVANSWATASNSYLMHFWNDETFLGNFILSVEKVISPNLMIVSGSGLIPAGANHFYIGSSNTVAGQHSISGGQAWVGTSDEPWIARTDYSGEIASSRPLIGKEIWMVSGRKMPVYPINLTGGRDDTPIKGGFYSLKGADKYPYFIEGSDQITIDPDQCGTDGTFVFRRTGVGGDKSKRMAVPVTVKVSAAAKTGSRKILVIGDSLVNAGFPRRLDLKLTAMGVTPTWMGTINTTDTYFSENATNGLPGEGRGGREFGDYIHALTVKMTVPSSPAAYIAADKATKVGQNPFIRPATGGDAANLIFNGYVFDFQYYITNYLAGFQPDIVLIGLGTNDREFETDAVAVQNATNGIRVMMTQIRAALPSVPIGWYMPSAPRAHAIDGGRWARGEKIMRACVGWILQSGDANMHVIPAWAHISPEIGWWLNASPDAADNVAKNTIADVIHFGPDPAPLREQLAESVFAFIANQV